MVDDVLPQQEPASPAPENGVEIPPETEPVNVTDFIPGETEKERVLRKVLGRKFNKGGDA